MDIKEVMKEIKGTMEELKAGLMTQKELEARIGALEEKLAERNIPLLDGNDEKEAFATWFKAALSQDVETLKTFYKDAMGESVDADGGYLVPEEFYPSVMRIVEQYGTVRAGATIIPMKTDTLNVPTLSSGVQLHWVAENTEESGQKPQFGNVKLEAKKGIAIVPVSNELLEDAGVSISNLLISLFGEAIAEEEDTQGFVGSGSPFTGILNSSSVNVVSMASGNTAFTDITADDLSNLIAAVTSGAAKGAKFYLHRTVLNVVRKLKDTNGDYIWSAPGGDTPGTIWGYPYEQVEVMPDIADSGAATPFIAFGNLKHLYLGDRKKMAVAKSVHAGFTADQTLVRVTHRIALSVGIGSAFAVLQTAAS